MSRRKRIHLPGVPCHVTARIQSGEPLFSGIERHVSRHVLEVAHAYETPLLAYAVMSNHLHLVPVQTDAALGVLMQALLRRIALMVQRVHGRTGHVFCGPYFVRPCLDPEYLRHVLAYVHLNPVRAGICGVAADYEWSTHRSYSACAELAWKQSATLAPHVGLRLFARQQQASLRDCVTGYHRFLEYRRKCDLLFEPLQDVLMPKGLPPAPVFPAGDSFWVQMFGRSADAAAETLSSVPVPLEELSTITRRALAEADPPITVDDVRNGRRTAAMTELRRALIARCLQAGHRAGQIARYLQVSTSSVSRVSAELRQARLNQLS